MLKNIDKKLWKEKTMIKKTDGKICVLHRNMLLYYLKLFDRFEASKTEPAVSKKQNMKSLPRQS